MDRIKTPTRQVNKFGDGPFGPRDGFRDGTPATGVSSTQLEADFFDQLQEEIARCIEMTGIPTDPNDMTQLFQAIQRIAVAANPDLSAYVLKSGDTMTGQLLAPAIVSTGNLTADGIIHPGFASTGGAFYIQGLTDARIIHFQSGYFFSWGNASGDLVYNAAGTPVTTWNNQGDLRVMRDIFAGHNVTVTESVTVGSGVAYGGTIAQDDPVAFRYQQAASALQLFINQQYRGNIDLAGFPLSVIAEPSTIDALAAVQAISLGRYQQTITDRADGDTSVIDIELGFVDEDGPKYAKSPYLVRALQQLAERVAVLESASKTQ